MVRWAWSLKTRAGDGREKEEYQFRRGDPRPDFMCVGAQKGGTSWLYQQLASHPAFWMPRIKELHYFDLLSRPKTGPRHPRDGRDIWFLERVKELAGRSYIDLENYARLFEPKGPLLSGDITPAYSMLNDEIIERITGFFPNLKVIFLARDPVERAWSQLSMAVRVGMMRPFDVTNIDEVLRNLLHPGVLLRSYPSKIVARWRRHVRPDLFRLYFFDDLERNPTELRRSVLDFLGADPDAPSGRFRPDHNRSAGKEKLRLTDNVRSCVAHFFKDELLACAKELGGPAKGWPARYGFSLLWYFAGLADDLELFFWCDWLA
jgi:hypothetical protein